MPFKIIREDIIKVEADAVVNAANMTLQMGGGVCGAIFSAAGIEPLQKECNQIGGCETGKAVITKGYNLLAKYIIHTVGPIWQGGNKKEQEQLYNCYKNSLDLALANNCKSIAFPLIASGIFMYPKEEALNTAVLAIGDFLLENEMMVYLVVYDKKSFEVSKKRLYDVKKYIDDNYVNIQLRRYGRRQEIYEERDSIEIKELNKLEFRVESELTKASKRNLKDVVMELDETFSQRLLRIIDEKGLTDAQTYNKANIDRRLFSKIRKNTQYKPSKVTAIAFCIALELNLDDTLDMLKTVGFTLSHSDKSDVIIEYCINNKIFNIYEINEILFEFDQDILCA